MKVKGLTQAEADLRLKKDGLNQVPEPEFSFGRNLPASFGISVPGFWRRHSSWNVP